MEQYEIKVKLGEILDLLGISAHKLALESKIRHSTIYDLINNKKPTITLKTLAKIIYTLNKIAEENEKPYKFSTEDILEYIEKK